VIREACETPTADVRAALTAMFDSPVESIERRPYAYRTSFAIDALDVQLAGGRRLRLLLKDLGAASEKALAAKPSFLVDPLREIDVYREILSRHTLGTPHCFGAVVDPGSGRYWVVLEHVSGAVLWQIGELGVWQEAARWLAGLHTTCRGVSHPRLLRYDRSSYETWLARARAATGEPRLDRVAAGYDSVVQRLLELPPTFIHGEFYPSNVLVETRGGSVRVAAIDWEMAAIGPGLVDLAALTAGWSEPERERIAFAYSEALPDPGSEDAFLEALECCRLHIALQWLGWAKEWSPPAEHAQDWLAEALRAAERIGIG